MTSLVTWEVPERKALVLNSSPGSSVPHRLTGEECFALTQSLLSADSKHGYDGRIPVSGGHWRMSASAESPAKPHFLYFRFNQASLP